MQIIMYCTEYFLLSKYFFSVIRMIARNDKNKKSLAAHGVIPLLIMLAEGKDVEEQRGIYTIYYIYKVKSVLRGHLWDKEKVVLSDR